MIGLRHAEYLSEALTDILGRPNQGDVAFLRCLPSMLLDALIDMSTFKVVGWNVCAVVDLPGPRRVTADQAVEQREDKSDPVLFLIDPLRAGAGLDGIYSASREISEAALFSRAHECVRRRLWGKRPFLRAAQRRAERLGRRHKLTPWQIFDFLVAVDEGRAGSAVARVGLWPIQCEGAPEDSELDLAGLLVERLLVSQDARAISDRVKGLLLDDPSGAQTAALEKFLRDVGDRSPLQVTTELLNHEDLWIGQLQPRFSGDSLKVIHLTSWRGPRGNVAKWSGLQDPEDESGKPRLILDRKAPVKNQSRLEVRWTTEPDSLPKGTIEYRVSILAGDEELAEQVVAHREKPPQKAVFSPDDFEDFDLDAKFEAFVRISAIAVDDVQPVQSEEFVLEFGQPEKKTTAGSGHIVRTLVDGAIAISTREEFDEVTKDGHLPPRSSEDKKGFISWRMESGRSVRVLRPLLIRQIEESWADNEGRIGRWIVRVRADGSQASAPEFEPLDSETCESGTWERLKEAARKLAGDVGPLGLLSRILAVRWLAADSYVNSWIAALETAEPQIALHGTVEVQTVAGKTIGLIVTPIHPLRFAWHALYDQVVVHARYSQELSPSAIQKTLERLDSANFPAVLPGPRPGPGYVFADTLGFHAVAMTHDGDPEPKAAVALMTVCLGGGMQTVGPSIGAESVAVLAREIRYYLDCHRRRSDTQNGGLNLLNVQAWRPGDGMTVARSLGAVLRGLEPTAEDDDERESEPSLCFTLDLYHPVGTLPVSGGFLSDVARRRRSGGGVLDARDRWMTETAGRPGEIIIPRLRWARRDEASTKLHPAHISLAFDVFEARLVAKPADELGGEVRPLHCFGLSKVMERRAQLGDEPEWIVFTAPRSEGEKAPDNRASTDRLLRLDSALSRATVRFLGGGPSDWPVLRTQLPPKSQRWIGQLHKNSDWVVTVDRNACLEYFDAPRALPDIYEQFVIDCVPERSDLGSLQLITSTSNLDEVRDLVDEALGDMGLSSSERNSRFLLANLKALSGRLAIRLANPAGRTGELIALALMHAHCVQSEEASEAWLDLEQGFFVPVDEIIDVTPVRGAAEVESDVEGNRRADFIHVRAGARGPLEFRFVEVKHRLHLKTARQLELLSAMLKQTGDLRRRWHTYFFEPSLTPIERSVRRSQLSRILEFYADRAARHRLLPQAHERLKKEIDQLLTKETYRPAEVDEPDIGYIFCPEHRAGRPERLYATDGEEARLWLFGPALLPEDRVAVSEVAPFSPSVYEEVLGGAAVTDAESDSTPAQGKSSLQVAAETPAKETAGGNEVENVSAVDRGAPELAPVDIVLGSALGGSDEVSWRVSIRANPHLMIVGLPGMGKTTCLINICRQLAKANTAPIIFSYHEDIDSKLEQELGSVDYVDFTGLGFNPLRVDSSEHTAYVDVAGTLRDIFGSIFPDLGDLQLEELRQAVKQSYTDIGWGNRSPEGNPKQVPAFRAFFDILSAKPKPNLGLLARLQELADYGFFDSSGDRTSLLDGKDATVVRIHRSTNGMLQNAFSSFILYSLYKDMFRRGVQSRLTHAVIFDEAHRASRLKLIPQFGKECRKFGLALALASQEARDFDPSLFAAVGSYLALRVTEPDARALARMTGSTLEEKRIADRLKALDRYTALFFSEGRPRPLGVDLKSGE